MSTDDIVLRLRSHADDAENWSDRVVGHVQAVWLRGFALVMRDAAFEIERLREIERKYDVHTAPARSGFLLPEAQKRIRFCAACGG